ncbi:hypothetical protein MKZ38_010071 [Zalerion maritima]|uniref:E2 ubiquitin-conjugating enzyme n=1 Tax=Zalerion maritima TaxID=339359 RepID=A0AAD5WUD5_9PEZI|nr:hypothetical protein MKZ38_010071 [Zalerion maritima]
MSGKRIAKEFAECSTEPPEGMTIALPDEGNLKKWHITLAGPKGSVYEGGKFGVVLELPNDYPFKSPSVRFTTHVYHPNITNDEQGSICLAMLKADSWKPASKLRGVLEAVRNLLMEPQPDDPLEARIAEQYRHERGAFDNAAKDYVNRHDHENDKAVETENPENNSNTKTETNAPLKTQNGTQSTGGLVYPGPGDSSTQDGPFLAQGDGDPDKECTKVLYGETLAAAILLASSDDRSTMSAALPSEIQGQGAPRGRTSRLEVGLERPWYALERYDRRTQNVLLSENPVETNGLLKSLPPYYLGQVGLVLSPPDRITGKPPNRSPQGHQGSTTHDSSATASAAAAAHAPTISPMYKDPNKRKLHRLLHNLLVARQLQHPEGMVVWNQDNWEVGQWAPRRGTPAKREECDTGFLTPRTRTPMLGSMVGTPRDATPNTTRGSSSSVRLSPLAAPFQPGSGPEPDAPPRHDYVVHLSAIALAAMNRKGGTRNATAAAKTSTGEEGENTKLAPLPDNTGPSGEGGEDISPVSSSIAVRLPVFGPTPSEGEQAEEEQAVEESRDEIEPPASVFIGARLPFFGPPPLPAPAPAPTFIAARLPLFRSARSNDAET